MDEQPIPLLEHYARAAWVRTGPEDEANAGIRDESNDMAQVRDPTACWRTAQPLSTG